MKLTIRQAAERLGISPQAVHKKLKASGISAKRDEVSGWLVLNKQQWRKLAAQAGPKGNKQGFPPS